VSVFTATNKVWRRLTGRAPRSYQGGEAATWMSFTLTGMFTLQDVYVLDEAVKRLPSNKPMVEIGSFCGRSTCFLTHLLERHDKPNQLYCSDKWHFEGYNAKGCVPGTRLPFSAFRKYVRGTFVNNLKTWHPKRLPHAVESTSDEFFTAWTKGAKARDVFGRACRLGGPISFALIDGDHGYAQTRADLDAVDRHLDPGGLVFAKVKTGEFEFTGRVRNAAVFLPGLGARNTMVKNPLTDEQLLVWRTVIEQLAVDFLQGRAAVDPRYYPETCDHCSLTALCRVADNRPAGEVLAGQ